MEPQFVDRILKCIDCHGEFVFTAGEQLFFHDKQFKNDPKRCKPCKSRRAGLSAVANGAPVAAAGISRTETRTQCSECGVETTVPFKPTQGRPVLCRQCFQVKAKAVAVPTVVADSPEAVMAQAVMERPEAPAGAGGLGLSSEVAMLAATSMLTASPQSSVATAADLASITGILAATAVEERTTSVIPAALVAAVARSENGDQPEA
jgi:CxxC-x17-CxxC domain-containing protein